MTERIAQTVVNGEDAPDNVLLKLNNIHLAYGAIQAVSGASLHVHQGEWVALIGSNGAGKSSILNAIAGSIKVQSGQVIYQKNNVTATLNYQRLRQGIALVPEGRGVFTRLTVAENLDMGAYIRHDAAAIQDDLALMYEHFPRLKERQHQLAGTLSGGEQQMLAIARALMSRPKLLLLDEPSMGLAPLVIEKIFQVLQAVVQQGMTLLLVEQNATLALEVSQRAYVLEQGHITLSGTSDALSRDENVMAAYLGGV